MKKFSICIPTFNRARTLKICLSYLAGFSSKDFELIIGDNCSTDNTAEVVKEFADIFPHMIYVQRKENIGFARNMDSILRIATREYIYILNDDDLVFENALMLIAGILDANSNVVAMSGTYISLRKLEPSLTVDYSDATVTTIQKNNQAGLFSNLSLCDAHPVMRREIFQRYCAYHDRTSMIIPTFMRLLCYGDILVLNKPIFQHLTSTTSLTTGMTEPWFIDMGMADLELSRAGLPGPIPGWSLEAAKTNLSQLFYFQAARMAFNKGDYLLLWLFLNRCKAVNAVSEELLVKCEYVFMHHFVIARLERLIGDSNCHQVFYVESELMNVLVAGLLGKCPTISFLKLSDAVSGKEIHMLICEQLADELVSMFEHTCVIRINDLVLNYRLTNFPINYLLEGQQLAIRYNDPVAVEMLNEDTGSFQRLCTVYSSIDDEEAVADALIESAAVTQAEIVAEPGNVQKKKRIGLIQTRGIGDIIIAMPIAKYYWNKGYEVYWPVDIEFFGFLQSVCPYVNFIPIDPSETGHSTLEYFYTKPLREIIAIGCQEYFILYSHLTGQDFTNPRLAASLKFDEYKYAISGVPFAEKWNLDIVRNIPAEQTLKERLNIKKNYVVVHSEGSNFKLDIELPEDVLNQYQVVHLDPISNNPFDWLTVLQDASMLVLIDSCFANLVEQLDIGKNRHLYLRSRTESTPVFKNAWMFH